MCFVLFLLCFQFSKKNFAGLHFYVLYLLLFCLAHAILSASSTKCALTSLPRAIPEGQWIPLTCCITLSLIRFYVFQPTIYTENIVRDINEAW